LFQAECHAVLKKVQDVHERKVRQLSHRIEILSRSCEVWEEECAELALKVGQLESEASQLRSASQDLTSRYDASQKQNQVLEEEVREAQIKAAAFAAHEEENREEANAQVEAVLEECQELQRKLNARNSSETLARPQASYFEAVDSGLQTTTDVVETLETLLLECGDRAHKSAAHSASQLQAMRDLAGLVADNTASISANARAVTVMQGDVERSFCKIPVKEFDLMQSRLNDQQRQLDELAETDESVRRECLETIMVLQELQAKSGTSPFILAPTSVQHEIQNI